MANSTDYQETNRTVVRTSYFWGIALTVSLIVAFWMLRELSSLSDKGTTEYILKIGFSYSVLLLSIMILVNTLSNKVIILLDENGITDYRLGARLTGLKNIPWSSIARVYKKYHGILSYVCVDLVDGRKRCMPVFFMNLDANTIVNTIKNALSGRN
ncbi:MAG: hypothetical protein OQK82_03170 [Candidatus Pacearchaeota archaeon]|nr:hypothetical protein [Candidatus Pacearchaeota archaeon]